MAARGLAPPRRRPRTGRRMSSDVGIAVAVCSLAAVVALLAPPSLRPVAAAAAFVAGATLERYRQGRRERPLRLEDTPGAWARAVRESVGVPYALAAGLATLAALAVLALPSLSGDDAGDEPAAPTTRDLARAGQALPRIEVARRSPRRQFVVGGLSFRVFPVDEPRKQAGTLRRPAGRGRIWLTVGVDIRNLSRRRFVPNALAYRLKDGRGRSYWPDIGGGTGPASLALTGHLGRGGLARMRLSFRVPRGERRLALVFEPGSAARLQVRVPLGRTASR
jgi:hypothetical protein